MRDAQAAEAPPPCPDRQAWTDFLLGRVAADAQDDLARHLQSCRACVAALAGLEQVGDELTEGLRAPACHDLFLQETAYTALAAKLAAQAEDASTAASGSRGDSAPRYALPAQVGRFVVRAFLGSGGFGLVYRAYDPRLRRDVALKVPRERGLFTATERRRLVLEGWAASCLSHRNLVTVYEADEADGVPYIASEYCEGPNLAQWLRGRTEPVGFRLAAQLTATLAEAVQHAHERGIFHRDIKPSNVLLAPLSGQTNGFPFVPKLADFGLAKLCPEALGNHEVTATQTGAALGTAEYMAPEQARGQSRDADARTDVYALGVVLYQLLTGRVPFRGDSRYQTLVQVERDPPTAPGRWRRGLPRDLATICLKCLEKSKDRRYASAALLADDLRRFLAGDPIRAKPVGAAERSWKWARRHPAVALLSAALLVGALGAGAMLLAANRGLHSALDLAKARNRALHERLYAAEIQRAWQAWQAGDLDGYREHLARYRPDDGSSGDDFRGFEWFYLDALGIAPRQELLLRGSAKGFGEVAFSPDGCTLAAGEIATGLVRVWDARSGRARFTLTGHQSDVNRVVFSPDGRTLASGGDDRTVRLWDLATRQCRAVLRGHAERVFEVAFAPDGGLIAAAGQADEIRLWDPKDGRHVGTLRSSAIVRALNFAPTGRRIVSAHQDGRFRVWDLSQSMAPPAPTSVVDPQEPDHFLGLTQLVFAPSGQLFVTVGTDHTIRLWSVADCRRLTTLHGHRGKIHSVAFSPDEQVLVTSSSDRTIRLWNFDGQPQATFVGHEGRVHSVTFSPDGDGLATAGADGTVRLWNLRRGARDSRGGAAYAFRAIDLDFGELPAYRCVALSPDGRQLATLCRDAAFRVLDWPSGRDVWRAAATGVGQLDWLTFSPDGSHLVVHSRDGRLLVWDVLQRQLRTEIRTVPGQARAVDFSPDGATLALCDGYQTVRLFETRSGRQTGTLAGKPLSAFSLAFSHDGQRLATGGTKGLVAIWDINHQIALQSLRGHQDFVGVLAFSPDGRTLAAAGNDMLVRLWDASTGREVQTLRGHVTNVTNLAFAPDGRTLVSADANGAVRFWQVATGLELMTLPGEGARFLSELRFGRGGSLFVATCRQEPAPLRCEVRELIAGPRFASNGPTP